MKKTILTTITGLGILSLSTSAAEWENSLDLGATITKGNSDSTLITAGITSALKEKSDEYLLNLFYTYGETEDDATNDDILANASWKHLVNEKQYLGARFDFLRDDIADLKYRATATAIAGTFLIKNDITRLSVEGGLGYTFEDQGGETNNYANLYFGEFFEHKFNESTKLYQSFTIFAPLDDFGNYNFISELGIETTLSKTLSLKVFVQNKYDAIPASGRDSNDVRFVTGISYKF